MNWQELYIETKNKFQAAGSDPAEFDAKQIVFEASGIESKDWLSEQSNPATQKGVSKVDQMVERRLAGEPLQYVLGSWGFRHLDLFIDQRVLIPRPETEEVAGWAIEILNSPEVAGTKKLIADLGTGSGAIGLSIAKEVKNAEVYLCDISTDALAVAKANLAGIGMAGANTHISSGSWFEALDVSLKNKFDLIISNPPYIAPDEKLDPSVKDWEPKLALVSEPAGVEFLEHLVKEAVHWLRPGGYLVLEMAPWQTDSIASLASQFYSKVEVKQDISGNNRCVIAKV